MKKYKAGIVVEIKDENYDGDEKFVLNSDEKNPDWNEDIINDEEDHEGDNNK